MAIHRKNDRNIIEQERELRHQIRQERNPRARKHLHKELRRIQNIAIPSLRLVE